MGTPDFAVPTLARLLADSGTQVVGVFTQPDRPAGRGRRTQPGPVKELAVRYRIPVHQPVSLRRDKAAVEALRALAPEVVVVAAYGLILPRSVLGIPPQGTLNVHASLLPRWRGAAPIQHAILAGDEETGVTIMLVEEGLDTGPMLTRRAVPIRPTDTAGAMTEQLSELGAELLVETLPKWVQGGLAPEPQVEALATYAPRLEREHGRLDWDLPAVDLARQVRALAPWPGTFTTWSGAPFKVLAASVVRDEDPPFAGPAASVVRDDDPPFAGPAGTVAPSAAEDGSPVVVTGDGRLRLDSVQASGGKAMPGRDFLRGRPGFLGASLGEGVQLVAKATDPAPSA